jgi:hypothetical protein
MAWYHKIPKYHSLRLMKNANFLLQAADTNDSVAMFEFTVPGWSQGSAATFA